MWMTHFDLQRAFGGLLFALLSILLFGVKSVGWILLGFFAGFTDVKGNSSDEVTDVVIGILILGIVCFICLYADGKLLHEQIQWILSQTKWFSFDQMKTRNG